MAREEGPLKRRFEEDDESRDAQPPKKRRRTNQKPKQSQTTEQKTKTSDSQQTTETTATTTTTTATTQSDGNSDNNNESNNTVSESSNVETTTRQRHRAASSKKRRYKKEKPITTDPGDRLLDARGFEIFPDVLQRPIVVDPPPGVKAQWEYNVGDKVLVWYGPKMQYEATIQARIADWNPAKDNFDYEFKVHYVGWPDTWDSWKSVIEIEPFSEEAGKVAAENRRERKKLVKKYGSRIEEIDKLERSDDKETENDARSDPNATSLEKRQAEAQYIDEEFRQVKFRKIEGRIEENCRLVHQMSRMIPLPAEKGARVVDICELFLKSKNVTNRHDADRRQYYQLIQNMLQLFDRVAMKRCLFENEWTYISTIANQTGLEPKRLLGLEHFARFLCEFGEILEKCKIHPATHNQIMKKANAFVSFIEKNLNKFWPRFKAYEDLDSLIDSANQK